ncbi:pseudouridine synthase [Albirhodobacter sp. R86504]|uniref:pseudouridine synthase n=1 Tax=Albirhodobacter sp. R86504 TaxID=3093848 RepID=UPI003671BF82
MTNYTYAPPNDPPQILHADGEILLVDKQAGLLSVPGKGPEKADCLINRLREIYPTVLLVHRLDTDTSGVMVFAMTPNAQRHLGLQFENRQTSKTYQARLWGEVTPDAGRVDLPLCVDWPNRPRQHVNFEKGRSAQTDWEVMARDNGTTRMRLMPITGRSHQLRVHMMELGYPILGDPLYATAEAQAFPRLMLHAETLSFRHPEGGANMTFTAPCPF